MPLSKRYSPEFPPGESSLFGMDFSFVLPPGAVITSASLSIFTNTFPLVDASADFMISPVTVQGSVAYARLSGGKEGTDYQLLWSISDSDSNIWPRVGLVLCAKTS